MKITPRNGLSKMPDKIITYLGKDITTLSKDELIKAIQNMIEYYEKELKREVHAREFMFEIMVGK